MKKVTWNKNQIFVYIVDYAVLCGSVDWENLTFRQLSRKKKNVLLNLTVGLFIALGSSKYAA